MRNSSSSSPQSQPLSRLRRIQRITLFGGGIAISLALLALTLLSLYGCPAKEMLADRHRMFDAENTALKVVLRGHAIDLHHQVSQAEAAWKALPRQARRYCANSLRTTAKPGCKSPRLILRRWPWANSPLNIRPRFEPYLALAEHAASAMCGGDCELRKSVNAYLYSPDQRFLAIVSPACPRWLPAKPDIRAALRLSVFSNMPNPTAGRQPAWRTLRRRA